MGDNQRNDLEEHITQLEDACDKLAEVIETIKSVIRRQPGEGRIESYLVSNLEMCLDNDHGWLGSNPVTISDVIEEFTERLH